MIGKTLQNILEQKGMNVNELSKIIGVSNQTLYSIIKRDNMKIDFEVLLKICSALEVDVEVFYQDYKKSNHSTQPQFSVTNHEKDVIIAYRKQPELQYAVDRLLNVETSETLTQKKNA